MEEDAFLVTTSPLNGSHSQQIPGLAAAQEGVCQFGHDHGGWIAAGNPGMVRLHRWSDPREHGQRPGQIPHLAAGAPVALAIMDPDNAYRYIQIRGRVKRAVEQGADAHIDSLAKKYLGKDTYPFRQPGEVRVMYEIEPVSVSGMD
jgi:hypothetical protein